MSEHFIKNIEIKNFKCFDNFKAEGFGRVNLIGGKNNVGKTAFMEACYINLQPTSQAISNILVARYFTDLFHKLLQEVGLKYIFNFLEKKSERLTGGAIKSNLSSTQISYKYEDLKHEKIFKNIGFLDNNLPASTSYDDWYSIIIESSREEELDKYIAYFDSDIEKFRIIKSKPVCNKKGDKQFYNLNEFGDGLSKFISFVLFLLSSNKGTVFIDEIENGIHYTNLDKLWEIILTISKEQNVQVFATTHSKECIESYARVAKRLEEEEITFIELFRDNDEIKTIVLDNEMLTYQLEQNHEVR